MPLVRRTGQAEADLLAIWLHLAERNLQAADRFLDRVDSLAQRLADNPYLGTSAESLPGGLRCLTVRGFRRYVLFYAPDPDGVVIVRVLHGMRNLPAVLEAG